MRVNGPLAVAALAVGALAVGVFAGAAPMADVLGWGTLQLGALAVVLAVRRWPELRHPVYAALALRVAFALVHTYVAPLPGAGEDAVWLERTGWEVSQLDADERAARFATGSRLYAWMIAWMYAATDRSPLMVIGVNVVLGTGVVLAAGRLAAALWGEREGRAAAWVTAVFPTLVLSSAIVLREMAVILPLTLGVLAFVHWQRTERLLPLAAGVGLLMLSAGFHSAVVFTVAGAVFLLARRTLAAAAGGRGRRALRLCAALLLAGAAAGAVVRSGWGLDKFGSVQGITEERLEQAQLRSGAGRSAYLPGLRVDGPVDALVQLPVRVVFFLFTPFPWMVRTGQDLFGLVDGVSYLVLAWLALRAVRGPGTAGRATPVLVLGGIVVAVFALGVSNYGTAIRHRGKTAPLLIALAAGGTRRSMAGRAPLRLDPAEAPPGPVVPLPAAAAGAASAS